MVQKIRNPLTGRLITVGKPTFKRVMKLRDNVSELQQDTKKLIQDTKKTQDKAREYLLKLNLQELQRDVKKQQKETKEKNKKAIDHLLELNYQELKRDVEKQQQKEKKKEEAQQAVLKLNIQELKNLAKKQLLQTTAREIAREERIKKHDEFETKILMVPQENNKIFHALKTYKIKPIDSNKYNYEQFLNDINYNANKLLTKELKAKKGIRAQFMLLANFYQASDEEQKLEEKHFLTKSNPLVNTHDINQAIEDYKASIMAKIDKFLANQSGWVFYEVKFMMINIYRWKA